MSTTPSRRIQSYPEAILRWKLNENASASGVISFANSGSYSGHAMAIGSSSAAAVTTGYPGVLDRGVRFNGGKTTQRTYLRAVPTQVPSTTVQMLTMSCWLIMRQFPTTNCTVFRKNRNSSLVNADSAYTMAIGVSTTGQIRCSVTTGAVQGSGTQTIVSSTSVLAVNEPYLVAVTYDGVSQRGFVNGQQVLVGAKTGNLDWGTDNSNLGGDWSIGGPTTTNVAQDGQIFDGIVEECIVETALISESMQLDRYRKGIGISPLSAA